jgi:hypothetical protein
MDSIHFSVNQEDDKKYRTINEKLNQLTKTQTTLIFNNNSTPV